MATLATQTITRAGLTPTFSAAGGSGDKFNPGDHTFLRVKNASGSSVTVTVVTPATVDGLAVADLTVTVPATTGDVSFGPFPVEAFRELSDGLVAVTYSATSSVTVAAVQV